MCLQMANTHTPCQCSLELKSTLHWDRATKASRGAQKDQEVTQITGSPETFSRNKEDGPESQSTVSIWWQD